MDNKELATILYKLSLDMDADDYFDFIDADIQAIENELKKIDSYSPLRYVLEVIAELH